MTATRQPPGAQSPPSDAWRPETPGDQLHGVVTDIDAAWSKFRAAKSPGDPDAGWYPLLTVRQDDGTEVKVHAFRTVLYNEVLRKKPVTGEAITITFIGVGGERDGMNGAHIYRVKVEGRAGTVDAYAGMAPASGPSAGGVTGELDAPAVDDDGDDTPY